MLKQSWARTCQVAHAYSQLCIGKPSWGASIGCWSCYYQFQGEHRGPLKLRVARAKDEGLALTSFREGAALVHPTTWRMGNGHQAGCLQGCCTVGPICWRAPLPWSQSVVHAHNGRPELLEARVGKAEAGASVRWLGHVLPCDWPTWRVDPTDCLVHFNMCRIFSCFYLRFFAINFLTFWYINFLKLSLIF